MKILDRYPARQLFPAWLWCLLIFVFLSVLIDLFEHLDEILRYAIPFHTILQYYVNFIPIVFVRACPLALLLSTAFIATRLVRYQELLAMSAGGVSRLRASIPFLFVGWVATVLVFLVNDRLVPQSVATYERLRQEAFRGETSQVSIERNVATMDRDNRLYHCREYDLHKRECLDVTILEQDRHNHPTRTITAKRATISDDGWRMEDGTLANLEPDGTLAGNLEAFQRELFVFPVTATELRQPDTELDRLSYTQLRDLMQRLRSVHVTNVRRLSVELGSRLAMPLMNVIVCLIAFAAATKPASRGRLQELGVSLGLGIGYYLIVGACQGMGKEGFIPVAVGVWAPHVVAIAMCWYAMWRRN